MSRMHVRNHKLLHQKVKLMHMHSKSLILQRLNEAAIEMLTAKVRLAQAELRLQLAAQRPPDVP